SRGGDRDDDRWRRRVVRRRQFDPGGRPRRPLRAGPRPSLRPVLDAPRGVGTGLRGGVAGSVRFGKRLHAAPALIREIARSQVAETWPVSRDGNVLGWESRGPFFSGSLVAAASPRTDAGGGGSPAAASSPISVCHGPRGRRAASRSLETTTAGAASWSMKAIRSAGYSPSSGTYAAPA